MLLRYLPFSGFDLVAKAPELAPLFSMFMTVGFPLFSIAFIKKTLSAPVFSSSG
jgi:hypothetical protein